MEAGIAVSAASAAPCGVKPATAQESLSHRGLKDANAEACPKEPAEDRMRDFLTFLDRTVSDSVGCDARSSTTAHPSADATSNANLLSKISALEVELEDKEHNLKALRELREREKLKEEHMRKQIQLQLREELTKTTEKYEQQVRRQQELLSQLQEEKKDVTSRCDRLSEELRELERKFGAKTAELHRQYGRELERQRKAFLSGEKARRDAWERDRAQEIKEITIKGLEPEIQRLIEKHRNEKRSLEEKLKRIAIDMKNQLEKEIITQKAVITRELQESIEVERSQHKQQIRELEENYAIQLRKEKEAMKAKHLEEVAKLEYQIQEETKRVEMAVMAVREEEGVRWREKREELLAEIERMKEEQSIECRRAAAAAEEREMNMKKRMDEEKDSAVARAVETAKQQAEELCRRKMDYLIGRLSEEQIEAQSRLELQCSEAVAAAHANTEKVKEVYVKERNKLELELRTEREERLELEKQISKLQTEAEMKEKLRVELQLALEEVHGKTQQIISERDSKTKALHSEWQRDREKYQIQREELESNRELLSSCRGQLIELKKEMKEMKEKETVRMETVESKVKETLAAKDKAIQRLKDELSASHTKVKHLRCLLQRRRSELLKESDSSYDSMIYDSSINLSTSSSLTSSIEGRETNKSPESALLASNKQGDAFRCTYTRVANGKTKVKSQINQKYSKDG